MGSPSALPDAKSWSSFQAEALLQCLAQRLETLAFAASEIWEVATNDNHLAALHEASIAL